MSEEIVLIYGTGGHTEESRRVLQYVGSALKHLRFISICDNDVKFFLTEKYYTIPSVTDKYSYLGVLLKIPKSLYSAFRVTSQLKRKHNVKYAISTGPGISAVLAPFLKLNRIKIIHIESGARFYSKSLSGRILYLLSDYFFIQNIELKSLYPKAIYKGRL